MAQAVEFPIPQKGGLCSSQFWHQFSFWRGSPWVHHTIADGMMVEQVQEEITRQDRKSKSAEELVCTFTTMLLQELTRVP
jgi:hypothetical protein